MEHHYLDTHVLKFGSGVVSNAEGRVRHDVIESIVDECAQMYNESIWTPIVTSGAINVGRGVLRLADDHPATPTEQALSTVGMPRLYDAYSRFFMSQYGIRTAQLLVSQNDFEGTRERQNLSNALDSLRSLGIIPIINENDAVSIEELRTDNDVIAGMSARLLDATGLVLVTENVNGVHDSDGERIERIYPDQQSHYEASVGTSAGEFNRGGMKSKYRVACDAANNGIPAVIMGLEDIDQLHQAFSRDVGTMFYTG